MYLIIILLSIPVLWAGCIFVLNVFKGNTIQGILLGILIFGMVSNVRFNIGYPNINIDMPFIILFIYNLALLAHMMLSSKINELKLDDISRTQLNRVILLLSSVLLVLFFQVYISQIYDIGLYSFHFNVFINLILLALFFYFLSVNQFSINTFFAVIVMYSICNSLLGVLQYVFNRSFLLSSASDSINYYEGAVVTKRVMGFVGASNGAGNLGAILFSVLLYYFLKKKNFFSGIALLLNILFVVLTFTRIGYLSIVIQCLIFVVFSKIRDKHQLLRRCLIGILSIFVGVIAYLIFFDDVYQILFINRGDTESNRFVQFNEAFRIMKENLWFGVGAGQYNSYIEANHGIQDIVLHSQFINILIEQGLISFILFSMIYIILFIWSTRVFKDDVWLPISLMIGNFIVVNFNPNQYYSMCILTFFILIYGLIFLKKTSVQEHVSNQSQHKIVTY
ncbi:O-antigen ligase family protein [Paenibacillus antarcticus]|uniref:O-antigen ligase-related domain-containing protein n=1 Tax=Paenibacillus antarcticus TaxID=253703 RepID=A0A168PTV4_9BACL|nr:O-antigen ligase family protein [Paenibacillus antarcticus]OAB47071.1 hypothetical protein PBAT_08420 [Paenibacillus antarcticus]